LHGVGAIDCTKAKAASPGLVRCVKPGCTKTGGRSAVSADAIGTLRVGLERRDPAQALALASPTERPQPSYGVIWHQPRACAKLPVG